MKHPPKRHGLSKWRDEMAVDIYRHTRAGMTLGQVAEAIGVSASTLIEQWQHKIPSVRHAIDEGRKDRDQDKKKAKGMAEGKEGEDGGLGMGAKRGDLASYCQHRLSPELKRIWNELSFWFEHPDGPEKIEELLAKEGVYVRQKLWVQAMVETCFNASEACRMTGVNKRMIDWWTQKDANFIMMIEELEYHKKNFFESHLVDLVRAYDSKAIIHVNKTINADRGYGDRTVVEHKGTINHNHFVVSVDKLNLPLETLIQVRDAIRAQKELEPATELDFSPVSAPPEEQGVAVGADNEED